MFSHLWYMRGMKRVVVAILLTFCGTADIFRTFVSFLSQLQHYNRHFVKIIQVYFVILPYNPPTPPPRFIDFI